MGTEGDKWGRTLIDTFIKRKSKRILTPFLHEAGKTTCSSRTEEGVTRSSVLSSNVSSKRFFPEPAHGCFHL